MNENELKELISGRIAHLRVNICHMTQLDFAQAIGAKYQHIISDYESGRIKPGLARCKAMIRVALKHEKDIDLNWLRPDL